MCPLQRCVGITDLIFAVEALFRVPGSVPSVAGLAVLLSVSHAIPRECAAAWEEY